MTKALVFLAISVVFLAAACGGGAAAEPTATPEPIQQPTAAPVTGAFNVDILDFTHGDVTVPVGTTVAWANRGNVRHTTTEDNELWDSKALEPGQTFSFTFTQAGTYSYFCAIHPTMRAIVAVTDAEATTPIATQVTVAEATDVPQATVPTAAPTEAPGTTTVSSANIVDFSHQSLTVTAGTTVTWTNQGNAPHTSTSDDELWDSAVLGTGQTFSFTFSQPGTFGYFCAIHPAMTASITVTGSGATPPTPTTVAPAPTPEPQPTPTTIVAPTPTPAEEAPPVPLTVNADMVNFRHVDLALEVGTTVVWTNLDRVQHTVTSGSPSEPEPGSLFDSGAEIEDWVVQGETYSFTFNEAGVFPYYCRVHGASMSGTVTVTVTAARY